MEQTGCLQTASLRTLCSNCEDAFRIWDNLIAERDSSNAKLYKAVEVREGASSGCSICKLLTFASSPRWKPTYLDEFYFTVDKTHGTIHDTPYMMVNTDSIAGIDPVVIPWPKLRRWLSSCSQEDHGHIAQPSAQRYLDTWLIDVEDRCLKPMTQDSEYAALSYVWGGDQPVLLQRNTLALQQTGAFDNATACSQTIRDAMQVCHNVGIRYIWVMRPFMSTTNQMNVDKYSIG